ncbi:MAG: PDZ domain-containing protein, partial [Chloroflexi bacterium]|nr:PDZ domain-containing protein [Chloroflexota bacterium]
YSQFGHHEEAIKAYKPVTQIDPSNPDSYFSLAAQYRGMKRYGEAVESCKRACELTGYKNHICIAALAFFHAESGNFEKAVEYQERAIEAAGEKEFIGIGVNFNIIDGQIKVVNVVPNTPAHRSGLAIGDVIEAIDGQNVTGLSVEKAANIISGPIDTEVTLTIRRNQASTFMDIKLARERITNPLYAAYSERLEAYKANKIWSQQP